MDEYDIGVASDAGRRGGNSAFGVRALECAGIHEYAGIHRHPTTADAARQVPVIRGYRRHDRGRSEGGSATIGSRLGDLRAQIAVRFYRLTAPTSQV